jgi:hypothetical protein
MYYKRIIKWPTINYSKLKEDLKVTYKLLNPLNYLSVINSIVNKRSVVYIIKFSKKGNI